MCAPISIQAVLPDWAIFQSSWQKKLKLAQILRDVLGYFEKRHYKVKTALGLLFILSSGHTGCVYTYTYDRGRGSIPLICVWLKERDTHTLCEYLWVCCNMTR